MNEPLEIGDPDDLSDCTILKNMKDLSELRKENESLKHKIRQLEKEYEKLRRDCIYKSM